jgi:hypothetical protein
MSGVAVKRLPCPNTQETVSIVSPIAGGVSSARFFLVKNTERSYMG